MCCFVIEVSVGSIPLVVVDGDLGAVRRRVCRQTTVLPVQFTAHRLTAERPGVESSASVRTGR